MAWGGGGDDGVWLELIQLWNAGETDGKVWVEVTGEGEGGITSQLSHLFWPCSGVWGCRKRSSWGGRAGSRRCIESRQGEFSSERASSLRVPGRAHWLSCVPLSKAYRCSVLCWALKNAFVTWVMFSVIQKLFQKVHSWRRPMINPQLGCLWHQPCLSALPRFYFQAIGTQEGWTL